MKTRALVNSELYQLSFPYVKLERKTKTRLGTTEGGERRSYGTNSNVTGEHAHFILLDDLINPVMALSDKALAATNEWMDTTISSRQIVTDRVLTATLLMMQRLHQNDSTGYWLNKPENAGTVKHICLPADLHGKSEVKRRD